MAGRAVPGVPAHFERGERSGVDTSEPGKHALDIGGHNVARRDRAGPVLPIARRTQLPELGDVRPKKRTALKYHFEAIVIGGIVAASYLNAAIYLFA